MSVRIRDAKKEDLPAILKIVNFEIEYTTSIYDYDKRNLEYQTAWFEKKKQEKMPVIIAEENGQVIGFGTFGIFRPWDGYQFSVEHSIYLDKNSRGRGSGKKIMKELIHLAKERGFHTMIAGIDANNAKSLKFHHDFGFQEVGRFNQIGYKFEKWLDLIFMQLFLKEN
jgi:phosphinothricin acetyltransferase